MPRRKKPVRNKRKQRNPRGRVRSSLLRDFFVSGLSRKNHPHKPRTAYDRRMLRRDLEERIEDSGEG